MSRFQSLEIFGKLEPESSLRRDTLNSRYARICPPVEFRRDVGLRIGNTPPCRLRDEIVEHVDHTAVHVAGGIKRAHEERCSRCNAGKALLDCVQGLVVLRSDDHCLPCPKCGRGNGDDCLALACAGRPGYDRETRSSLHPVGIHEDVIGLHPQFDHVSVPDPHRSEEPDRPDRRSARLAPHVQRPTANGQPKATPFSSPSRRIKERACRRLSRQLCAIVQGSTTSTPVPSKSRTFLVTRTAPRERDMAAI